VLELSETWAPCAIAIDPKGPGGSLLTELRDAGLEVHEITATEQAQACGAFYNAAVGTPPDPADPDDEGKPPTLRHSDDPDLNTALAGARQRPLGDAWAWGRKPSAADISPLVAVTVAHHALALYGDADYDVLDSVY
jgi:hypothetical protein